MNICVICKELIFDVAYLELHLVEGVASVAYHQKCFVLSHAQLIKDTTKDTTKDAEVSTVSKLTEE